LRKINAETKNTVPGWIAAYDTLIHAGLRRVVPAAFTKVSALGIEEQRALKMPWERRTLLPMETTAPAAQDPTALVTALARHLRAETVETHISWVLLTRDLAYKIKKPVRLPFVDYSTVEARHRFCKEEVRLNRRLAPSLYLGVSRITGTYLSPAFDGSGPVLDHAVRMQRFPPNALFSELVETGHLEAEQVDGLTARLADFHIRAPVSAALCGFASANQRRTVALAALDGAAPAATQAEQNHLRAWLETSAAALAALWTTRQFDGHVKECHGDLHLDNLVSVDGEATAFDCIEFDPALRWIDVIDDIAFTVMDFSARKRIDYAFRLLNGWMDRTGDHGALPALRFSVVYRALVRAQVAHLRGNSTQVSRYLETAVSWTRPSPARLVITHGLPGSGKTFESQRLLEHEGAIRLRSDVERKRLFGLGMLENSRVAGVDLYTADVTARTYDRLFELAHNTVRCGYPVVLDAAFLRRDERDRARALARELGVPFAIVACDAPLAELRARLLDRQGDASEANIAVLERLKAVAEPLDADEQQLCQDRWISRA